MAGSSRSRADLLARRARPCHHGPVSVDFDPVKIGPRPRRIDPVRVVILVVVVGLAVAIVKPWAIGEPRMRRLHRLAAECLRSSPSAAVDARPDRADRPARRCDRRTDRRLGRGRAGDRGTRRLGRPGDPARSTPEPRERSGSRGSRSSGRGRRPTQPPSRSPAWRATTRRSSRSGSRSRLMSSRWTCGSGACTANEQVEWIDARPLAPATAMARSRSSDLIRPGVP